MIDYSAIDPGEMDIGAGIQLCGSEEIFLEILGVFCRETEKKAALIERLEKTEDIDEYTVQVHSLKSGAKLIGAFRLSEMALEMETLGRRGDIEAIHRQTGWLLAYYRGFAESAAALLHEELREKRPLDKAELKRLCSELIHALEDFDIDLAADLVAEINGMEPPPDLEDCLRDLSVLVDDIEYDGAARTAAEIRDSL